MSLSLSLSLRMRMFSEVFGSLSEEQRDQIRNWVKARVLENDFRCTPNNTRPKPLLSESMEASQPGLLVPYPSMNPGESHTPLELTRGGLFSLCRVILFFLLLAWTENLKPHHSSDNNTIPLQMFIILV